jgi:hypothetical protein
VEVLDLKKCNRAEMKQMVCFWSLMNILHK